MQQTTYFGSPGAAAAAVAAALSSQAPARVPGGAVRGPCFVKLLLQDRLAGVVIGKGGSGIAELEQATGATMRLSGSRIYFPGTTDRVLVGGGDMEAMERLISTLVDKLNTQDDHSSLRLVLTNSACAAVIGKGGEVIKNISARTGANIRASDRNPIVQERIVEVKGPSNQSVVMAVIDITHIIQEDVSFKEYAAMLNYFPMSPMLGDPTPSSSYYFPSPPTGSLAAAAAAAGAQAALLTKQPSNSALAALVDQYPMSVDFTVPSVAVGAIIGKNGDARSRIVHATGANLVVSERTTDPSADRKITISGPLAAVQAALTLVARLIVESQ
jgi:RNA-binding protein Nova